MKITGTVTYVNLSGGFWGITSDEGHKYALAQPLPHGYREEGLKVKVEIEPVQSFGIFMWGQNVEVLNIEKIV